MYQHIETIMPQVWLYPRQLSTEPYQPNIGIIDAGHKTILVDAGCNVHDGHRLLTALFTPGLPAVDTIIYTHHHWMQTFGAVAFGAKTIIAHELCALYLERITPLIGAIGNGQKESPLATTALQKELTRILKNGRHFKIQLPTIRFKSSMRLYHGEHEILIEHVGGGFAPDSVVVKLPRSGVMFLGNCFYSLATDVQMPDEQMPLNKPLLESLISDDYDVYISSFKDPMSRADMQALIDQSP